MYGLYRNQAFHVQYAYRQRLGKGYLSVGTDLGFLNIGFKGDSVNLKDMGDSQYHDQTDEFIPTGDASGMAFDIGLGVYYSTSTWWVSGSYSHVSQPKVVWTTSANKDIESRARGTMYIAGGYDYRLKHYRDWELLASAMLMTDFAGWDINATLLCEYKDRYRWGLGYRIAGSVNILLGVDIISGLQLGYSWELPTNKLMLESYGSHELYLAYGFDILKPKRTNKYKSIRYL